MIFSLQAFEVELSTNYLSSIFIAKTKTYQLTMISNQASFTLSSYCERYLIGSRGKQPPAQKPEGSIEVHQLRKKSFGG
jgi:hypothetical protein